MIDHKSMINQRIDTPVGRQHDDKDSDECHDPTPVPPPAPNDASTSVEKTDDLLGELRTRHSIVSPIAS